MGTWGGAVRLHADDVGLSDAVNAGVAALLAAGRLGGVSIVANGPATPAAAALVARHPEVEVHLHLNLTEGRPLADPARLGPLVDAAGRLPGPARMIAGLLRGRIPAAAVRCELDAQLARLRSLGVRVDAVDSHHHLHALAPVSDVVAALAAEEGLRMGRVYGLARTHTVGGAVRKAALAALARATERVANGHGGLPVSWRPPGGDLTPCFAMASWERLRLPVGDPALTVVCHPGGTCDRVLARG